MKMCAWMLLVALVAPLVLGNVVTETQKPWVDPNHVQGRLLISVELRAGLGLQVWGDVRDADGDSVAVTFLPAGRTDVTFTTDPNSGYYQWTWWPQAVDEGIWYFVLKASEAPVAPNGQILSDTGTFAVRVLPANRPPVITPGGCRILSK